MNLFQFLRQEQAANPRQSVAELLDKWRRVQEEPHHEFTRLLCLTGNRSVVRNEGVGREFLRLRMIRPFDGLAAAVSLFVTDVPWPEAEPVSIPLPSAGGGWTGRQRVAK
jgi:hypothetical protein